MRDAIVLGFDWVSASAVERIALALTHVGAKVLHCEAACSVLRRPDAGLRNPEKNLFTFKPVAFTSRFHRLPGMSRNQIAAIVQQVLGHAQALGLRDPIFVYPFAGTFLLEASKAMKARDFLLVYVAMDYKAGAELAHVELSDLTLAIPRSAFHWLRARWGQKIHQIPQGVDLRPYGALRADAEQAPPMLAAIPRPRLGYAGSARERLNARLLRELFERRPDWSFVSFDRTPAVALPNAHVLPWQNQEGLARCVAAFDVGFMPYDCFDVVQLNCMPLKLLDYFALGLPVVATPIIHLWEYEGLVYFGETAEELERAVQTALAEPTDCPKRQKRKEVAEAHSIEALGRALEGILS